METATYEIRLKDGFSQGLGNLETKMNKFEGKVGGLKGSFNGLGSTIAGAFAGGLVAGGITSLISGLKSITTEAFNTAREFTNLKDAISFASGQDATTNIKFLDSTIEKLGLDMQSTYKGFKTFQGALMGTSLEGKEGRHVFEAVSKAASVMKLSADATEGSFLALGQMISKGTVSAEELRGQLGERLPGAFQIAARAMKMSTAELGKMMQAGKLSAEEFLPKFADELEKTFGPGVLKAQDSFNANWNRFNNFIERGKIAFGTGLLPMINEFVSIIPRLDISYLTGPYEDLWIDIKQLFGAFNELFALFGANITTFDVVTAGLKYFSFMMRNALLPIRLLIEGYTEFLILIKGSLNVFTGLGQVLKGVFTGNLGLINKGIDTVGGAVINLGEKLKNSAGDFIDREKAGYAKLFSPFDSGKKKEPGFQEATSATKLRGSGSSGSVTGGKEIGVEKIQAGTRNVNVTINKLIDHVTFEKGYKESEAKLQEMITKALLVSVNDVNLVAQ